MSTGFWIIKAPEEWSGGVVECWMNIGQRSMGRLWKLIAIWSSARFKNLGHC